MEHRLSPLQKLTKKAENRQAFRQSRSVYSVGVTPIEGHSNADRRPVAPRSQKRPFFRAFGKPTPSSGNTDYECKNTDGKPINLQIQVVTAGHINLEASVMLQEINTFNYLH